MPQGGLCGCRTPGGGLRNSQEEQPLRLERWRHMQPAQHSQAPLGHRSAAAGAPARSNMWDCRLQPKGTAQLIDSLRLVRLPLAAQERELKQAPCIARLQCVACVKGILRFLRSPGRGIRQPQQIRRLSARVRLRVALEQRDCGEALLRSDEVRPSRSDLREVSPRCRAPSRTGSASFQDPAAAKAARSAAAPQGLSLLQ